MNTLVEAYLFGSRPEYFGLYNALVWPFMLFVVIRDWKATKKLLYLAEFCWWANAVGWVYLAAEIIHSSPSATYFNGSWLDPVSHLQPEERVAAGRIFFAMANGPLAFALIINKNSLVFHDGSRTSSCFIHLIPAVTSWAMRWRSRLYDGMFALDTRDTEAGTSSTFDAAGFWNPLMAYGVWWVIYAIWLLSIGHALPAKGWGDSSFKVRQPPKPD
jgi:hypothetical protein